MMRQKMKGILTTMIHHYVRVVTMNLMMKNKKQSTRSRKKKHWLQLKKKEHLLLQICSHQEWTHQLSWRQ